MFAHKTARCKPPSSKDPIAMNLFRMAGDLTHLLSFLVLLLKLYSCNSAAGAWLAGDPPSTWTRSPLPFTPTR